MFVVGLLVSSVLSFSGGIVMFWFGCWVCGLFVCCFLVVCGGCFAFSYDLYVLPGMIDLRWVLLVL